MSYKRPLITEEDMTSFIYNEIDNLKLYIYHDWHRLRSKKKKHVTEHIAIRSRIKYYIHRIHALENVLFIVQSYIHPRTIWTSESNRSQIIMPSKYAVGDLVTHTVFGTKTTGTINKVESMDSITDRYIYQIDNGSWWIAESDLTLVQYRPPEVTHQIKTIDDIFGLISALWAIDDSAIVSFEANAHPMTICMAGKDQSQASFRKEMIATIMLQIRRSIRVFIEISEPNKPKVFYQYIRGRNDK